MYPGRSRRSIVPSPPIPALPSPMPATAHVLFETRGRGGGRARRWRRPIRSPGLPAREASHIAFFDLLLAGDTEAALSALPAHLNEWPRDAVVLGTNAFTQRPEYGSSGRAGQKRTLLDLLDGLAPSYGDDWWFTAHHGMALSENGQRDAASPKIDRSLSQTRRTPGRRTPARTSAMRRAIRMRPALSSRLG